MFLQYDNFAGAYRFLLKISWVMVSMDTFRRMALSMPEATEEPHFEKTSFRVAKKIFATMDTSQQQVCIKLSEAEQDIFCLFDTTVIFPVPNKWGKHGWTFINLTKVKKDMLQDALEKSYCGVAPKKLAEQVKSGKK